MSKRQNTPKTYMKQTSGPTVANLNGMGKALQMRRNEGGTVTVSRNGYRPIVLRTKAEQEAFMEMAEAIKKGSVK